MTSFQPGINNNFVPEKEFSFDQRKKELETKPLNRRVTFNPSPIYNFVKESFLNKDVIIHSYRRGRKIIIKQENGEYFYTSDYKIYDEDEKIVNYLKTNIYNQLKSITDMFGLMDYNIYGTIGKFGVFIYDFHINENFFTFDDLKKLFSKINVLIPTLIFEGTLTTEELSLTIEKSPIFMIKNDSRLEKTRKVAINITK